MANVTLKGNPIHTGRRSPQGRQPESRLPSDPRHLSDISLADFEGKVEILNIVRRGKE